MNPQRHLLDDGATAITKDRITPIGKTDEVQHRYRADEIIDAKSFVITPGLVNAHIHITGDPRPRLRAR